MSVKVFVRGTLIAALYFTLTFALQPISYGQIQIRISEVLTVLPYFFPESILGLTIGCILDEHCAVARPEFREVLPGHYVECFKVNLPEQEKEVI